MSWVDYYESIDAFFHGLIFWIQLLPTWGMAIFTVLFSSLSSKAGILANLACGILVWQLFGQMWGLVFFGAGAAFVIIGILIAIATD